jgi:hypothetical protein
LGCHFEVEKDEEDDVNRLVVRVMLWMQLVRGSLFVTSEAVPGSRRIGPQSGDNYEWLGDTSALLSVLF